MTSTPEFLKSYLPTGATSGFPGPGDFVKPDGWQIGANIFPSTWSGADFFIHLNSKGPIRYLAVNIKITGRTIQNPFGNSSLAGDWVRVKITFVKEDEPNVETSGWMLIDSRRKRPNARFSADFETFYGGS